jgi:hypothetical protein
MNENALAEALEAVRARISRADQDRAELERTIAVAREEERLLERLIALRRGANPLEAVTASEATARRAGPGSAPIEHAPPARRLGHPAVEAVVRELGNAGRAVHISDLMRLLREAQVEIPGAGSQANLITHLRRDPRLVRPSRGMYGLAEWGLENMARTKQRKRRRRRVHSRAKRQEIET